MFAILTSPSWKQYLSTTQTKGDEFLAGIFGETSKF
jgi:hypothetical protein